MTKLAVHMGGQLVGMLDAADRRSLRFTYDPDYAADTIRDHIVSWAAGRGHDLADTPKA